MIHRNAVPGQIDYFMTSFAFPTWLQYFQSFKNDALVKQMIVMACFNIWGDDDDKIPFNYMHRLVQDAGYITSPDADRAAEMVLLAISHITGLSRHVETFLFHSEYSGPFHCTQDEYVSTYCHMLTTCRRLCNIKHLTEFLDAWTSRLERMVHTNKVFSTAHPDLLKSLKSEAQEFHDNDMFIQQLTHLSHRCLFSWFKEIKCPHEIMDSWQKAFEKARSSTLEGLTGYSYFNCGSTCETCSLQLTRATGSS
ncbi:hypothetical protein BDQ17DRAFT_1362505 [Cyathus striatus]|nr:hypothetical protein BDQ17DRAFT_1362505 [Cyathus striatus]